MQETIAPITNTRIIAQEFDYISPASLQEAVEILAEHSGKARILAGGTDLLLQMKVERERAEMLVDIRRIPGLTDITVDDHGLRIGALATHWQLERSQALWRDYSALAEAATYIGGVQIRAMGTLGGNLGNASPAADTVPPLLVMEAGVQILGPEGERVIPMSEFFLGPGKSILEADEIIVAVSAPAVGPYIGSGFTRLSRVASDLAKVSAAALIEREGDRIARARIALGSVFRTPVRAREAESELQGQSYSEASLSRASAVAVQEIDPISDLRSTREYRQKMSAVLVRDALKLAWSRSMPERT
jgi:carbon-monoxide dehydrogenase medium subunit